MTVGRNGVVAANISAREIVVLGKVRGNMTASDRVDIRGEGSLTGDVVAQRISIEDGAYFKGGIDIRKPGQKANGESKETPRPPRGAESALQRRRSGCDRMWKRYHEQVVLSVSSALLHSGERLSVHCGQRTDRRSQCF